MPQSERAKALGKKGGTVSPQVLLIDLSAIFYPSWHANESGPVTVAYEATVGGVNRCIATAGPGALVAVCLDSRGNWRKELSPAYKAHREPLPPVFYAQFDKVKERLAADGLLMWGAEGFEADDIIATAAAGLSEHPILIATGDKDLFQLVDDRVKVLSLSTFEVRDAAMVEGKFGVKPAQIGDWLSLVGDASDGIKGAPGIGPKRAAELLNKYGTLFEVLKASYDLKNAMTPAIRASLSDNGAQIELARKLVTMRTDAPINFAEIFEKRDVKPLVTTEEELAPHDLSEIEAGLEAAAERNPPVAGLECGLLCSVCQAGPCTRIKGHPCSDHGNGCDCGQQHGIVAQQAQQTELVTVEYSKQLEPRSFRDVLTFAKYAFNSRLYQKFTSPDAIAMVVVRGRELGYGASTALEVFHVIEGRPYPFAYLVVAECQKDPDCEYLLPVEFDDVHAVVETKHRKIAEPIKLTYTMEQARIAGLVKDKGGWAKHPEDMLVKTALCKLGRRMYPARALGLVSLEEMGEA
jgi:5'-3' exonuclease